jgi:hypothetical protein
MIVDAWAVYTHVPTSYRQSSTSKMIVVIFVAIMSLIIVTIT